MVRLNNIGPLLSTVQLKSFDFSGVAKLALTFTFINKMYTKVLIDQF